VLRKTSPGELPDDLLPSVMTCMNFVKLPEYSCYEVLQDKFLHAMNEGARMFFFN